MGLKEIWGTLVQGSIQTLLIGATLGSIGIIVGTIELTGIGLQFTNIIVSLSEQLSYDFVPQTLIAVFLIAIASLILGMGTPVTAVYLITIVLVAPSLSELGVSLISIALAIFIYFLQTLRSRRHKLT